MSFLDTTTSATGSVTTIPATVTLAYNPSGLRAEYTLAEQGKTTLDEKFTYRNGVLGQMQLVQGSLAYTDTYLYTEAGTPYELLRQQSGVTNRYWYEVDGRGNVVALTDSNGKVVDRYAYDSWGELTSNDGIDETVPQQLRYAGYWYDEKLSWYWLRVRYYDPEIARFLAPDPSQQDGLRTYVYVGDDPIDAADPLGLDGICDVLFLGGPVCLVGSVAHGAYDLIAGDDLTTLSSKHSSGIDRFLAVVDLGTNVLTFVPIVGEGVAGAKLALKAAFKVGSRVVAREVNYAGAVRIVTQLGKRGAKGAVEAAVAACARCFPAGTLVATPHGAQAIETLRIGDLVLSENPATGRVEPEMVQAVIADLVSPLIAVDLSDGSAITVTADHPFWLDGGVMAPKAGWIQAGDLLLGDRLRTPTGKDAVVLGVRRGVGQAVVYTLTVAKDHTFFVGAARVLVHNATCLRSLVRSVRPLFDLAREFGQDNNLSREARDLVERYIAGIPNPGVETKRLFGNIFYLRSRNGARVFLRSVGSDAFEILAYANKATETRVIALLERYYRE